MLSERFYIYLFIFIFFRLFFPSSLSLCPLTFPLSLVHPSSRRHPLRTVTRCRLERVFLRSTSRFVVVVRVNVHYYYYHLCRYYYYHCRSCLQGTQYYPADEFCPSLKLAGLDYRSHRNSSAEVGNKRSTPTTSARRHDRGFIFVSAPPSSHPPTRVSALQHHCIIITIIIYYIYMYGV